MNKSKQLPNSVAVLILGICSILFGCFLIGLVLGILGIVLSGKGRRLYRDEPEVYEGYGLLNAGYIMSIIGVVISSLWIIYFVIYVVIMGGLLMGIGNLNEYLDSF
ncbi:MAG: CCC motif membrane protein [Sphingobacteriaceae bacterium]|nr:CCC motif membrane protein [Sphingobacteriaceae bacterium]